MAEKKDKKDEGAGEEKKKKPMLLIIAIAVVALILLGAGGYLFLAKKEPPPEEKKDPAQNVPVPDLSQKPDIGPMVEVKEFIVNIISQDGNHYVKASLSIELSSDAAQAEVNQRMPQIRDAILMLVGNKTYEELQDLQGKRQLKAEIISKINTFLRTGRVNNIYFTDFVVQ
ncbi:MAG: flagellar basal body-associated FliL family protein [Desulfobulbaceae bacterium]|jgi:flagellar FliL protein|nr:flagellar basal body-associated FliL family protein [Desulfobulbaceae bacterium]